MTSAKATGVVVYEVAPSKVTPASRSWQDTLSLNSHSVDRETEEKEMFASARNNGGYMRCRRYSAAASWDRRTHEI